MSPENVIWGLWSVLNDAGQIDGAPDVDVHFRPAQNRC